MGEDRGGRLSGAEASKFPFGPPDVLALALVAALAAVCLVVGLRELPVQIWDEARLAINAIEMNRTGDWLVPTFHGEIDLWNPKPPLATWLSALSMRMFGINEVALRMPSLAAAFLTTFAVFAFTRNVSNDRATGVLGAVILLGTGGFVEVHVARTADPDSLLALFLTLTAFALFLALEWLEAGRERKWFLLAAASFSCAVLTKGAAALLIVPGYALAIVVAGKLTAVISSPGAWVSAAIAVATAALYWGAVEAAHPGYLAAVWSSDVAGRFAAVSDQHSGPFYYYVRELLRPWQYSTLNGLRDTLYTGSALPWSLVVAVLAPMIIRSPESRGHRAGIFCLATLAGFLVMISAAATKLSWYVAPAFPLIAVASALEVRELALRLRGSKGLGRAVIPSTFVVGLICIGLAIAKNEEEAASAAFSPDERMPAFLSQLPPALTDHRSVSVISDAHWDVPSIRGGRFQGRESYNGPVEFYVDAARARGGNMRIVDPRIEMPTGDLIVGCGLQLPDDKQLIVLRHGPCGALAQAE